MAEPVVAILGAAGMLGTDLVAACEERGIAARGYDLPAFDITDAAQLRGAIDGADAVINCAAYTNVDGAETESVLAHRINAEAVGRLGAFARDAGTWVLHFSTDFVFDGRLDRPYGETDAPNPINEYGRSKLAGEQRLLESGCRSCIMRIEWTYGSHGKNFVTKVIERAGQGGGLKVVDDQIGSPTATTEVAAMACMLLERRAEGLFHFAGAGYASRFDVAQFILRRCAPQTELSACPSSDFATPAQRPLNSRFDCGKIRTLLNQSIRPWQETLESFLRQL
ncbi:MAG: dTDP-4-dehydrorhamnose reductase [Sedimentisphaerales bacterium]|nr:dTDP-4-dehydrorhamnose reductase [Sedimentisphaerales bacterium]